jgi:hypothetical protein
VKVAHWQDGEKETLWQSDLLLVGGCLSPSFPSRRNIGRWTNGNDFLPRHLVPTGAWVHKGCPIFIVSRFLSRRPPWPARLLLCRCCPSPFCLLSNFGDCRDCPVYRLRGLR